MVKNKWLRLMAYPISWLWSIIYKFRRFCYKYKIFKSRYYKVPIISVGNISFGGTGKTPIIIWLAQKIEDLNLSPMILTRGYKGQLENSNALVSSTDVFKKSSQMIGDEPLMIIESLKKSSIVVGKKRSENLEKYYSKVESDIVLLDDGFQHLNINRDLNIVLIDASVDIKLYKVAPIGCLREGLSSLIDVDILCFTKVDQVSPNKFDDLLKYLTPHLKSNVSFARCYYKPRGIYSLENEKVYEIDQLKGKKVISFTALAAPESFNQSLKSLGAQIVSTKVYKDHHYFSASELKEAIYEAKEQDAIIIMSKKDAVKVKSISQDLILNYLDITVEFLSGQKHLEAQLHKLLKLD